MPLPPLLALLGPATCGKDSVAGHLKGFRRLAFADLLKQRVATCLNISVDHLEREKHQLRDALVAVGRAGRFLDTETWSRPVLNESDVLRRAGFPVVITDCRYASEARGVHAHGGVVVSLSREGVGFANREEADSIPAAMELADLHVRNVTGRPDLAARQIVEFFNWTAE